VKKINLDCRKKDFNSVALWIFRIHRNLREAQTSKINRTDKQTNKKSQNTPKVRNVLVF